MIIVSHSKYFQLSELNTDSKGKRVYVCRWYVREKRERERERDRGEREREEREREREIEREREREREREITL